MKKFYAVTIILFLFVSLTTMAQEDKKEQLWYCYVETVEPSSLFEYREMSKELADLAKEHDFPFSFHVWATRDLDYEIWYPINSLDDIDAIEDTWDEIIDSWGKEKAVAFGKTKSKNYSFTMTTHYDLSYQPENPRTELDSAEYIQYQEFHLIPGKQKEVEAVIKDANALLAEHNYDDAWYIGKAGIGVETPCLFAWSFAKDMKDYYAQDKKFQGELGEAFKPLNKRFLACISHVKSQEIFYKKEFSYETK